MKIRGFFVMVLIGFFLLALLGTTISEAKQRTALVIGNGNYKSSPLSNPVNDASDIAKALQNLGFTVLHKKNATQRDMEQAIRKFGKSLRKHGGVGLFYYAGHGIQVNGRNYLIPVDAEIETESDVKFEAVDAGRVLGKMEDADNDLNIVILDACRDNPFARSFRSSTHGLARMDAPRGSIIAYATAPGSVAADGRGRNGVFTKYLLKHMDIPGLPIEEVFKNVRTDVLDESNERQIPWESSSLTGNFYFKSGRGIAVRKRPTKDPEGRLGQEKATLERERRELERLRTEIERQRLESERKRLQAEKKELEAASLANKPSKAPPSSTSEVVKRDGVFAAYANGIMRDTSTGLEWKAGPDKDMTWEEAKSWVRNLNLDGGGWRMPTMKELQGIRRKSTHVKRNNLPPLLKSNARLVWSVEKSGSKVKYFNFGFGTWWNYNYPSESGDKRAFAVRSRSDG